VRSLLFVLLVLFAIAAASTAFGDTVVPSGDVAGTWSVAGSPCLIQGDITVPEDSVLTIAPGVEIQFEGHYRFSIEGALTAVGTAQDSIRFTAVDPQEWQGIRIQDSADPTQLGYCIIERGAATGSGNDQYGGGIYCASSVASISHCTIQNNRALGQGGGLCIELPPGEAVATLSDCTIRGNQAGLNGGGIYYAGPHVVLQRCQLLANQSDQSGGGVYCFVYLERTAQIDGCTFTDNQSEDDGGGLEISGGGGIECAVSECAFSENRCPGEGGAIRIQASVATVTDCSFFSNAYLSGADGAAIYVIGSTSTISHCTFDHHFASVGAVNCHCSDTRIESCTFSQNIAYNTGYDLYLPGNAAAGATIVNTIFSGNTLAGWQEAMVFLGEGTYTVEYCDIFARGGAQTFAGVGVPVDLGSLVSINAVGDSCDAYSNILLRPRLCDITYGAPGDLRLAEDSPCLGAGEGGVDIGALGIGCTVSPVEEITWGRLKSLYR
jgi:hypothetical protein